MFASTTRRLALALTLSTFAACSGGGGGKSSDGTKADPLALYQGSWNLTIRTTGSSDPQRVGKEETNTKVFELVDGRIRIADQDGTITGAMVGDQLVLERQGMTVALTMDPVTPDRFHGTGSSRKQEEQQGVMVETVETFAIRGVRAGPAKDPGKDPGNGNQGGAVALATGPWTFTVTLAGGGQLIFENGSLTQRGQDVEFEKVDRSVNPPMEQTFRGALRGRSWAPQVTGSLPMSVTGEFAADGKSFAGSFDSPAFGKGTIRGERL